MKTGVYAIRNKTNNKMYIGNTRSSFVTRLQQHRSNLRCNTHYNKHLQTEFNEYGADSFEGLILEECEPENCYERELHYIKLHNTIDPEFGYNKSVSDAGRPPHDPPLEWKRVYLTKEQSALLRTWGRGDLSAGLRWLIEAAAPLVHRAEEKE